MTQSEADRAAEQPHADDYGFAILGSVLRKGTQLGCLLELASEEIQKGRVSFFGIGTFKSVARTFQRQQFSFN